jgi:hypothetical protein
VHVEIYLNETNPFVPYTDGDQCRLVIAYVIALDDDTAILRDAFERFNVGTDELAASYRAVNRSLSVGDLVKIEDRLYACEPAGWRSVV